MQAHRTYRHSRSQSLHTVIFTAIAFRLILATVRLAGWLIRMAVRAVRYLACRVLR